MNVDKKLLPSISMLAALDATARKGSFTRAAEELSVTHGAISRQIQALESQLGVSLCVRSARGVRLTEIGEKYAAEVHSVLTTLRNASLNVISDPKGSTIDLSVMPAFGTRWLIPRLPDFLKHHPDLTVNFVTRHASTRFEEDHIDVAIHNCEPGWAGAESTFLLGEPAYPVCSPELSQRLSGQLEPDDPDLPLLGLKSRPDAWRDWFAEGGLEEPHEHNMMIFENFSTLTHAAVASLGVALLPRFLVKMELERGTLIKLSKRATANEMAYYFITPRKKKAYEPVLLFRRWLFDTIEHEKNGGTAFSVAQAKERDAELRP
jgi:LysR family glycine cleavage system transcriptional activator